MNDRPYTRQELLTGPAFPPDRGDPCPHCGLRIPQFADVSEDDMIRIRELMRQGRMLMAIQELRAATQAPMAFAQLWVEHRGRLLPPEGPASCPHCGKPLRTGLAKQCRYCKRDWHDPDNMTYLATDR